MWLDGSVDNNEKLQIYCSKKLEQTKDAWVPALNH